MDLYTWRSAAAVTALAVPMAAVAEASYRRLLVLPSASGSDRISQLPALSVIIPARDEATNLPYLLPSLAALIYDGDLEIIIVDDGSTDDTGEIAAAFGARVITLAGPPPGWKGKPHACHAGASAARGEWLLFTDADTIHAPDGPARSVALARDSGLDGLSLMPEQRFSGLADRLALENAFAGLFASGAMRDGMLNGQYILIRKEVYFASGGFEAVRADALEDVALGHRLRSLGYSVPMALGDDAVQVRMYSSWSQMWSGLTRLGQGALKWTGWRAVLPAILTTALVSPLVALTGVLLGYLAWPWLAGAWVIAALCILPWAHRLGNPVDALLAPLGALIVLGAALKGLADRLLGRGIRWKGRRV
jgi:chlorobactene glucosyltransferase